MAILDLEENALFLLYKIIERIDGEKGPKIVKYKNVENLKINILMKCSKIEHKKEVR